MIVNSLALNVGSIRVQLLHMSIKCQSVPGQNTEPHVALNEQVSTLHCSWLPSVCERGKLLGTLDKSAVNAAIYKPANT